jgi:hypothetical protein
MAHRSGPDHWQRDSENSSLRYRLAARNARLPTDSDGRANDDGQSSPAPFRPISFQKKNGLILLDQVRTLDKQRLVRCLGAVEAKTLRATLACLRDIFAE